MSTRAELKARTSRWAKGGAASILPLDDIFEDALREVVRTTHPVDLDAFTELDPEDAAQFQGQIYSYPLPADALKPFHVTNNSRRLRSKRSDHLVEFYAQGARNIGNSNRPAFYAVAGPRSILIGPGPGGVVRVGYHSEDAFVTSETGANIGMGLFPDVYFWAMMKGVHSFYENTEGFSVAERRFDTLRADVNNVAAELRRGGGGVAANW